MSKSQSYLGCQNAPKIGYMSFLAVHGMEEMLSRTRVVCVNQQFFLPENLRGELCKSGMHLAICGVRWEAARADGGGVGQHTGRMAEETGSFSGIALRCRSWWAKQLLCSCKVSL